MTQKKSTTAKKTLSAAQSSDTDNAESSASFDFETSFSELEKIVDKLENGQINLEQSLQDFERGIHLTRSCQTALNNAQQKVQILLEKEVLQKNDQSNLEDYE